MHRDIKPANLFLCRLGGQFDFVKVLDFGLVKPVVAQGDVSGAGSDSQGQLDSTDLALTELGAAIVGTPSFMAPEQVLGQEIDGRTDVYALGCVTFWLLTGKPVFDVPNLYAMLNAHVRKAPPLISAVVGEDVPGALEDLVQRCLAKDPGQRPASAAELGRALGDIAGKLPWTETDAEDWWTRFQPDTQPEELIQEEAELTVRVTVDTFLE